MAKHPSKLETAPTEWLWDQQTQNTINMSSYHPGHHLRDSVSLGLLLHEPVRAARDVKQDELQIRRNRHRVDIPAAFFFFFLLSAPGLSDRCSLSRRHKQTQADHRWATSKASTGRFAEKKKKAIKTTNILDSTSRAKRKSTPYIDFTRSASVKLPRLIYFIL